MNSETYQKLLEEIKRETTPPQDAFTARMLADDLECSPGKAEDTIIPQWIEKGRIRAVGVYPSANGKPTTYYQIVEDPSD